MKGFTLIELMIVVAIIAIIAAIAIPSLLETQTAAWQTAAAGTLKTTLTAIETFRTKYGDYPSSETSLRTDTGNARLLFETTPDDCPTVTGNQECPTINPAPARTYSFVFTRTDASNWNCTASTDRTDINSFYVDQDGYIRYVQGVGPATSASPPWGG